ncbi:hypothetical protein BJY04DRAFT_216427 [Aspergillus karnatakaensis]|uniref:uncharacterized protein n=1 Tax=Aspergillus karnatakaensis TaxID=1810916 RepID=UPI003CCD3D05
MDQVFAKIAANTTKFELGDEEEWRKLYEPFYEGPSPNVHRIHDERYGPAERNRLDVYVPINNKTPGKPVLVFVHGGGFFSGDKAWSEKCWANIGNFFARHGIVVVIPNHRLVPDVQYPGGAEDMQLAREWIHRNIALDTYGGGSVDKVILCGHSSGAAHIASNLYAAGDPSKQPARDPLSPPVGGVMYFSPPFWFDNTRPIRRRTLEQYFGSHDEETWGPVSPLGLFRGLPDTSPVLDAGLLPVYIGTVEWEVKEATDAAIAFFNEYRARSRPKDTLPIFHVLDRHNHLSNILSIGTEDTAQAAMILDFVARCAEAIDLRDYESRREELTKQLVEAAETAGFLTLTNHGITVDEINAQFALSKAFFDLPIDVKAKIPHSLTTNNGWEYYSQIRPSTGVPDQKESFWLQRNSEWPSDDDVPGFNSGTRNFIAKCEDISNKVLTCFSIALGFPEDYFCKAMDTTQPDNLTQLRLLHYPASHGATAASGSWRAGVHTDIGCLTLLFQRDGEDGLEICPGRESHASSASATDDSSFFPLPAETGPIVVNIGDMLMAWSDDRLKANFHRVRAKDVGYSPDRYSIAYFNTGRKNVVMQGPLKKYPAITCNEYFLHHTKIQFGHNAKKEEEPAAGKPVEPEVAIVAAA